jgi:hypothetical protein
MALDDREISRDPMAAPTAALIGVTLWFSALSLPGAEPLIDPALAARHFAEAREVCDRDGDLGAQFWLGIKAGATRRRSKHREAIAVTEMGR